MKRAAHIDYADVLKRSQEGQGLTLLEAAVRYGLAYDTLCNAKGDGLPLFGGKLFEADFALWRQMRTGLVTRDRAAASRPLGKLTAKPTCEYL